MSDEELDRLEATWRVTGSTVDEVNGSAAIARSLIAQARERNRLRAALESITTIRHDWIDREDVRAAVELAKGIARAALNRKDAAQ